LPPPQANSSAAGRRGRIGRARRPRRERVLALFTGASILCSGSPRNPLLDELMPHRQRYLFVCTNRRPDGHAKGSCAEKGSEAIVPALKEALAARGVAKDIVRACSSSCLDLCESGISVVQEPEHVAYGGVTLADVGAIADAAARGEIVERLVVQGLEQYKEREKRRAG
jgi:(2Fe-2S) ferredoxin